MEERGSCIFPNHELNSKLFSFEYHFLWKWFFSREPQVAKIQIVRFIIVKTKNEQTKSNNKFNNITQTWHRKYFEYFLCLRNYRIWVCFRFCLHSFKNPDDFWLSHVYIMLMQFDRTYFVPQWKELYTHQSHDFHFIYELSFILSKFHRGFAICKTYIWVLSSKKFVNFFSFLKRMMQEKNQTHKTDPILMFEERTFSNCHILQSQRGHSLS